MGIGQKSFKSTAPKVKPRRSPATPPAAPIMRRACLLSRMDLWDALTAEDHAMLCELPPPSRHAFLSGSITSSMTRAPCPGDSCATSWPGGISRPRHRSSWATIWARGFAGTAGGEPGEASRELRGLMKPVADRSHRPAGKRSRGPGEQRSGRAGPAARPARAAPHPLRRAPAGLMAVNRRRSHRQGLEIPHGRYNVRLAQARATAAPPDPADRCHTAHNRPLHRKDCIPNVRPPPCL
jgi:hypothetical protein